MGKDKRVKASVEVADSSLDFDGPLAVVRPADSIARRAVPSARVTVSALLP